MAVTSQLRAAARSWLDDDPDPRTRSELADLLAAADDEPAAAAELADRFARRLEFGTAGLRGEMAAGPNRMNRAVVIRAAAGLASYLRETVLDGTVRAGTVVIGYDARHSSDVFAWDTADVMHAAGLEAAVLPRPLPTPVLAFAVRHLGCIAGIMVTASHNPPRDNGYKVYLGDGAQIVPPVDTEISRLIDAVGSVSGVPRTGGWRTLGDDLLDSYLDAVAALVAVDSPRGLSVVYTPLHGVGGETVERAMQRAGFARPLVVPEQARPDAAFPTVAFPNPEEPGAMDLAIALAVTEGADLVVANDPDADRCAVAVQTAKGWRMLRGDEVGVLLADHRLRSGVGGVFATTIVSSSLLGKVARARGIVYRETLTGLKWICRVEGLTYGYEEALGYCVAPHLVRDKDGVSALLLMVELAAGLKAQGRTLVDRLDDIAREFGLHATDLLSVRVDELCLIDAAMDRLRASPPRLLGGFVVESSDDLSSPSTDLPPTNGLRYRLAEGGRVVVRPSGTEPKIKCYVEVVVPVDSDVEAARISAAGRLDAIRSDLAAAAGL